MNSQKLLWFAASAITLLLLMQPVASVSLRDVFGAFINLGKSDQTALDAYDVWPDPPDGVVNFGDIIYLLQQVFGIGRGRIKCSSNADCGGTVQSDPFCDGNSVMFNVIDNICLNPGKPQSRCDSNSTTFLQEACAYGCVNGSCLIQCSDSDGGKDYYVKGIIRGSKLSWDPDNTEEKEFNDVCVDFNIGEYGQVVDSCEPHEACKVDEYSCQDGTIHYDYVLCPNGCQDGACIQEAAPEVCSSNADCGGTVQSDPFCDVNNVMFTVTDNNCINPGTGQSRCDSNSETFLQEACAYGCVNGSCLTQCSDSDGGKDYYVKGIIRGSKLSWDPDNTEEKEFNDVCVDFNIGEYGQVVDSCEPHEACKVDEYSCQDGTIHYDYVLCPNGCQDGACIQEAAP